MKHTIPVDQLGVAGQVMADAVEKCVHCGFCLAACPTYRLLGEEMDSPRGRIVLMKSVLEEDVSLEEALPYIDRCLGCQACVPACPSGVPYGDLLNAFNGHTEPERSRPASERFTRGAVHQTLPYPGRFRWAARAGRVAGPIKNWLPEKFTRMLDLLPETLPKEESLQELNPAEGLRRGRVALLTGCVQAVLAPQINAATIRVLTKNGVEVVIPKEQGCCGALAWHSGDQALARRLAQHNLEVFPRDVDAILVNAAGCGSGMKEYPQFFREAAPAGRANEISAKVMDVSEYLYNLGIYEPPPLNMPLIAAYQDACHLIHAQGVAAAPRGLLGKIPNLTLSPVDEADMCCGSAGTYNLEQPEIARELGLRKAKNLSDTSAEIIVSGNIGCIVQIRTSLSRLGKRVPIYHTMEVLDRAYRKVDLLV